MVYCVCCNRILYEREWYIQMAVRPTEGNLIQMKKKHPCGSDIFEVLRVGSDMRIRCKGCGRDVTVPRVKLEPSIKKIVQEKGN